MLVPVEISCHNEHLVEGTTMSLQNQNHACSPQHEGVSFPQLKVRFPLKGTKKKGILKSTQALVATANFFFSCRWEHGGAPGPVR